MSCCTPQATDLELFLASHGCQHIAFLVFWLRLQCPYANGTIQHDVWLEQCQINLPMLILASHKLELYCQENRIERILFLTRDDCVWRPIFAALYKTRDVRRLIASRFLFVTGDEEYAKYVAELYDPSNSVLVDLHGSGHHAFHFFRKYAHLLGPNEPRMFFLSSEHPSNHARILSGSRSTPQVEMLSPDTVGTYYDFKAGVGLCRANEHPEELVQTVAQIRDLAVQQMNVISLQLDDRVPHDLLLDFILGTLKPEQTCVQRYSTHVVSHF